MALSITILRREFEVRTWSKIIEQNPYVAVVQITGGRAWGRSNMKARILGKHMGAEDVCARYAISRAAREGASRTKFNALSALFRSSGCAVIYGHKVQPVVEVVKRAREQLDGGILVGGRFGNDVVTARVWEMVLESDGEKAEWGKFYSVLARQPGVVDVLDRSSAGLVDAIREGGGANRLSRVLDRVGEREGT